MSIHPHEHHISISINRILYISLHLQTRQTVFMFAQPLCLLKTEEVIV